MQCLRWFSILLVGAVALPPSPPSTCTDGLLSIGESDVDCGGVCEPCFSGRRCRSTSDCYGSGVVCGVVRWSDIDASAVCLDAAASSLELGLEADARPYAFLHIQLLLRGVDLSWCRPALLSALQASLAEQAGASDVSSLSPSALAVIDRVSVDVSLLSPLSGGRDSSSVGRVLRSNPDLSCVAGRPCAINVEARLALTRGMPVDAEVARLNTDEGAAALMRAVALAVTGAIPAAHARAVPVIALLTAPVLPVALLPVLLELPDSWGQPSLADEPNTSSTQSSTPASTSSPSADGSVVPAGGEVALYGTRSAIIAALAVLGVCTVAIFACLCACDMRNGPHCGVRLLWLATVCGLWPLPPEDIGGDQSAPRSRDGAAGEKKRGSLLPSSPLLPARQGRGSGALIDSAPDLISTENPIGQAAARGSGAPRSSMDSRMLAAVARAVTAEHGPRDRHGGILAPARQSLGGTVLSEASFRSHSFGPSGARAAPSDHGGHE